MKLLWHNLIHAGILIGITTSLILLIGAVFLFIIFAMQNNLVVGTLLGFVVTILAVAIAATVAGHEL